LESSQEPGTEPWRFVRVGLLFYGAMAAVAVLWREGAYRESIWWAPGALPAGQPPTVSGLVSALASGLAVGGLVVAVSWWLTRTTQWGRALSDALAEQIGSLRLPDAILLATASGFAEELFFRGALQPRVGLVGASLLFGALHFVPRRELLPWTAFTVGMGFVLGALFEQTGTLLAPIAAHTLINAVNLPLLARRARTAAGE